MDSSDAPALFVPEGNEDSVDIYEGLDFSSSSKNVTPVKSVPSGLKEAMDLFEEIVTEEQQSKDASYMELKSRFQAAQSQITELHRRLEQLELQNTGLSKENCRLKMNISILLQTARQEVTRKDAEIQRLNQQSSKGYYYQSRNQQDPSCSSQNQRLAPPPPVVPPASSASQPSSRPRLLPSKEAIAPPPPPVVPAASSASQPSSRPRLLPSKEAIAPPPPSVVPAASSASQPSSRPRLLPSKEAIAPPPPRSAPTVASELLRHTDASSRIQPPLDIAAPTPPPHKKTPSLPDMPPLPPAPLRPHPPPLPVAPLREDVPYHLRRDTEKPTKPRLSSERAPRKDSHTSEKHRYQTNKHKERRRDFERRNNSSNVGSDRHESRHSHKDETSNLGDSKSGEKKSKGSGSAGGKGYVSKQDSGLRKERRDRSRDRRNRGSESKERERQRDSSRIEHRPSKGPQSKEGRQERKEEDDKRHRRDSHSKEKYRSKEHSKKHSKPSEISSKVKIVIEQVAENSPNRKLCFMETLNLTLSPVKKPKVDREGGQKGSISTAKPEEDSLCLPSMEDMCVIDEAESSEPETTSRNCVEQSNGVPKSTPPPDKRKSVDSQKETVNISTTSEIELLENNSVQSAHANKAAEIQKDIPKCVNGSTTEGNQEAVIESNITEDVVSLSPTETPESNNGTNTSKSISHLLEDDVSKTAEGKSEDQNVSADIPQNTPPASSADTQDVSSPETTPKEVEMVSSSISLESLPQEGLSLPEAINLLTQNNVDNSSTPPPESTTTDYTGVSKVSSTTQDTSVLDRYTEISQTPKKTISPAKFFSPTKSSEKCIKPSSSVPLFHDEESMMLTLSSLKKIPDVISPLRSPVRISKRNLHHLQKPGHVKSLHKEFSSAPSDATSKKVDINKENKQPDSPAKDDPVALAMPLDPELEEGEILSESDEVTSPFPPTKRSKLTRPIRTKASPNCVLKHKTEEKSVSDKEASDSLDTTQSPANKSRFKTVCPAATKATFSSIEEVMDTFKLVRAEIRKKYMKLHKTFPKKSFYGVMENFQESFIEFVDGADFGQICELTKELKSKLKKKIVSVFSKVLKNGIVKRIFEQQAVDLKQKLWDFVDVQVNYLFKDVNTALKSMCTLSRSPIEHGTSKGSDKRRKESPVKTKEQQSPPSLSRSKQCAAVPFRTGLGSRGKGIRIALDQSDDTDDQSGPEPSTAVNTVPSTPEKGNSSLVVAHNASVLDKTDFELLTEQQATSLTFNLVRDSQMGEIFKCLLQGSDLLDSSGAAGEQSTWTLSTPRKDGERIITITTPGKFHSPSKLLSPNKFESPSRLITTWSSLSPCKISSQSSKVLLNPALFDESCLLEVPTENKIIHRPYSILAEDLAVSLTIPSPLKSDSHLSFFQSPPFLSTPDSVLSAHICEDALLDEADATEHDIHLSLDTDNSSCGSSASVGSQGAPKQFLFKPDLPMQALVMERSNDHFILKIRQASSANTTLTANESQSQTLTEEMDCRESKSTNNLSSSVQNHTGESIHALVEDYDKLDEAQMTHLPMQDIPKHIFSDTEQPLNTSQSSIDISQSPAAKLVQKDNTGTDEIFVPVRTEGSLEMPFSHASSSHASSSEREEVASESERSLTIIVELESTPEKPHVRKCRDRKRKKNQVKSKAKKRRTDEENCEAPGEEPLSPNSLSAKNLVRRKGEVVMAWTREEDRMILLELKTKGASRETFSFLSEKLDKPSGQIAQRFHQLMKLFKKQEKLDT
ncbi:CASP8-associated protein 2 isoform X2 [Eucyclogobius newberryi]|uniref:CASP8-associated protein 2 isoform X2 n=1 Tax=Eucyclogobius newberryi TaxID=166745 RepID=UPI003B5B6DCC